MATQRRKLPKQEYNCSILWLNKHQLTWYDIQWALLLSMYITGLKMSPLGICYGAPFLCYSVRSHHSDAGHQGKILINKVPIGIGPQQFRQAPNLPWGRKPIMMPPWELLSNKTVSAINSYNSHSFCLAEVDGVGYVVHYKLWIIWFVLKKCHDLNAKTRWPVRQIIIFCTDL
jgi:hypothetical protein